MKWIPAHGLARRRARAPVYPEGLRLDTALFLDCATHAALTRHEWESVHAATRIIFKVINPELPLPVIYRGEIPSGLQCFFQ
jgi:hypothetical protein